jgi:general secretion pathway protein J
MSTPRHWPDPRWGEAGFTLVEMMIATTLMVFIVAALGTVTAQWLPNWNHGMARMERDERLAFALNRIVGDLSVAEFVPVSGKAKTPYFDGSELSVSFLRTAIGPNSHPGLEFVRIRETADVGGLALIRERASFAPMDADVPVRLTDPVVLIRAPYRVTFAYSGSDDTWQPTWQKAALLPTRIRVTIREGVTQQRLAVSTATLIHIDTPAECVRAKNVGQCITQIGTGANNEAATNETATPGEPQ